MNKKNIQYRKENHYCTRVFGLKNHVILPNVCCSYTGFLFQNAHSWHYIIYILQSGRTEELRNISSHVFRGSQQKIKRLSFVLWMTGDQRQLSKRSGSVRQYFRKMRPKLDKEWGPLWAKTVAQTPVGKINCTGVRALKEGGEQVRHKESRSETDLETRELCSEMAKKSQGQLRGCQPGNGESVNQSLT